MKVLSSHDGQFIIQGILAESTTTSLSGLDAIPVVSACTTPSLELEEPEATPGISTEPQLQIRRQKRKNAEEWIQEKRKKLRNSGLSYVTKTGKTQPNKTVGGPCNCKNECWLLVPDEERLQVFEKFWGLANFDRQNDMIAAMVHREAVKRRRGADQCHSDFPRKNCTFHFHVNSKKVCKVFFLQTLAITEKRVRTVMGKLVDGNVVPESDKRGRHLGKNKLPGSVISHAVEHIESFPRVPAHWCRANTKKEYLEATLNKETMFKLYLEYCAKNKYQPVGKTTYMEIIIKKNIGFHTPKKDSCWCVFFHELPINEQERREDEYKNHILMKNLAKEEKERDAERARIDHNYFSGNFDLQAVLYCPLFHGKPLFYKRKLATFNLTFYDVGKKKGHCYVWNETEAKRGGIEIGTCIMKFLTCLADQGYKDVAFFSDSCYGQNKNNVVATAVLAFLQTARKKLINIIDLKFLQPGHTNMECDSMHATIERASKNAKINMPDDWLNVMRLAKKTHPLYEVTTLNCNDFIDFKEMRARYFPNMSYTEEGSKVMWREIKWLRFLANEPKKIFFKIQMDGEFEKIDTAQMRAVRQKRNISIDEPIELIPAYFQKEPISFAKYNDLMSLCKSNVIQQQYHSYYQQLARKAQGDDADDDEDDIALSVMRERLKKKK